MTMTKKKSASCSCTRGFGRLQYLMLKGTLDIVVTPDSETQTGFCQLPVQQRCTWLSATNLQNEKAGWAGMKKLEGLNSDNSRPIPMSPASKSTPHLPDSDDNDQSPDDSEGGKSSRTNVIRIPPPRARKASPANSISTTVSEMGLEYGESFLRVREPKLEEEEVLLDDEDDEDIEVVEKPVSKQRKPRKSTSGSKKATRSGTDPHAIWVQLTNRGILRQNKVGSEKTEGKKVDRPEETMCGHLITHSPSAHLSDKRVSSRA